MRRKVVKVVGNCQASAVANFYREHVGALNGEDVTFIDDLGLDVSALQAAVADADMLIVQERDFKHGLSAEEIGRPIDVFRFPLVLCGFLWPFANEPHVHNVSERPVSDGPYPSQMGDSFLNKLIRKGAEPQEALEIYRSIDIASVAHLDRMAQIYLDRQRARDAITGFDVANAIESRFRDENLFLTAEHPDAFIFGLIARQLLEQMGVPGAVTASALQSLVRTPFPPTQLPLHPGVARHFGLSYGGEGSRYTFLDEGSFTFDEFVLRYMRYENNPPMRRAFFMSRHEDPHATLSVLDDALAISPGSASGWRLRGTLFDRLHRFDDAAEAYRVSLSMAPDDLDTLVHLAQSRMWAAEFPTAIEAAERAVALAPCHAPAQLVLAEVLVNSGAAAAALAPAEQAVQLAPGRPTAYRCLALALHANARNSEAEAQARTGFAMEPGNADHANILAEILETVARRGEAIALLDDAVANDVANAQSFSLLGNFHLRNGEFALAEQAFGRGAELYGAARQDLRDCHAEVRTMLG